MFRRALSRTARRHATTTATSLSLKSIFMFLLGVVVIAVIAIILLSILMNYINKNRNSEKRKRKVAEFEKRHPAKKGHEADLAFGGLFVNATTKTVKIEPTRSLEMMTFSKFPFALKKWDLQRSWGIVNTATAKSCLEDLKNQEAVSYNQDLVEILKEALHQFSEKPTEITYDYDPESTVAPIDRMKFYVLPIVVKKLDEGFSDPQNRFTWKELSAVTDIAAWDIERLAGLARKCYAAGYITADECYEYLAEARKQALAHYNSWREYFIGLMYGRALIYHVRSIVMYTECIPDFLESKDSIWNEYQNIWK